MRGRPFEVAWREEDTTEALKTAYRRERDIELRTRLRIGIPLQETHGLKQGEAERGQ